MEKKSREGPPIYMESLLSVSEYFECSRMYPNTYMNRVWRNLGEFKPNEFKCRYRMGGNLTSEEIVIINKRIDELKLLLAPQHDTHRAGDGHYPGLPFHP